MKKFLLYFLLLNISIGCEEVARFHLQFNDRSWKKNLLITSVDVDSIHTSDSSFHLSAIYLIEISGSDQRGWRAAFGVVAGALMGSFWSDFMCVSRPGNTKRNDMFSGSAAGGVIGCLNGLPKQLIISEITPADRTERIQRFLTEGNEYVKTKFQ